MPGLTPPLIYFFTIMLEVSRLLVRTSLGSQIMKRLVPNITELERLTHIGSSGILYDIKKLRGFSPQANYTGQATAACRRS
jgi:hypothetical protein